MLLLFKCCILPHYDVGDIFYSGANDNHLKGLQTVQNKCIKTIYGNKCWPGILNAHRENNLLLCSEGRGLNLMKYAHKKSLNASNRRPHHVRELRSNRKLLLKVTAAKNKKCSKLMYVYICKLWNSLSEDLKRIREVKLFTKRIKKELLLNKLNFPE